MDDREIEMIAEMHSLERFEDQSGRDGADGSLILADALTYAAGVAAVIHALLNAMDMDWSFDIHAKLLIGAGFGLWLCSQSLNNFRRLLPVWLRLLLGMRVMPETFEEQSLGARKRRMWTMVIAALLTSAIAVEFTMSDSMVTRSGVPFHIVLWCIAIIDLAVALQWNRLIGRSNQIEARPGGWQY